MVKPAGTRARGQAIRTGTIERGSGRVFLAASTVAELRYGALFAEWGTPRRERLEMPGANWEPAIRHFRALRIPEQSDVEVTLRGELSACGQRPVASSGPILVSAHRKPVKRHDRLADLIRRWRRSTTSERSSSWRP
jgi:hypothetical protein